MDSELLTAFGALGAAARITRVAQQRLVGTETLTKRDRSPVTAADFASQAVISGILLEAFPDIPLVGEEEACALREPKNAAMKEQVVAWVRSEVPHVRDDDQVLAWIDRGAMPCAERFWTLDPIDGTKGFLRKGQYAIALALIERGEVVLGLMACPNLDLGSDTGALFTAVLGHGTRVAPIDAHSSSQPVSVGPAVGFDAARLCESVEVDHSDHARSARVAAALGITGEPLRMDSQAKYGAVARGDAQVYLRLPTRADYRECIWDHAAGMLVVTEAGGRVTDVDGKALDFGRGRRLSNNRGVIATGSVDHGAVVDAVRTVLA